MVSVIIPVYNRSFQLYRAICSVNNQKVEDYEVIVVDDCSKNGDEIREICSKFPKVKLIRHERNKNGSAARNTGIRNSSGKFIAFLDSDDEWLQDKVVKCLSVLESMPQIHFVFSKLEKIGVQKGVFPKSALGENENLIDYLLIRDGTIQTSTLFFRREIFDEISFDENLKRFQDYDLVYQIQLKNYRGYFIEDVLVNQFDDDQINRISNSVDPRPAVEWIEKIESNISPKAKNYYSIKRITKYYKDNGNFFEALKTLLTSCRYVHYTLLVYTFCYILLPKFMLKFLKNLKRIL